MKKIVYYRSGKEIKVDWKLNMDGNLDLFINDEQQPLTICLAKSNIGKCEIVGFYNRRICGSSTKYKLGCFKKRLLKAHYNITQTYEEA